MKGPVRFIAIAALVAVTTGMTGCGPTASSAAQQVPELRTSLSELDANLAAAQYGKARRSLTQISDQTNSALANGKITSEQAQSINAAIEKLRADLANPPTPTPTPSLSITTATPTPTPTATPTPTVTLTVSPSTSRPRPSPSRSTPSTKPTTPSDKPTPTRTLSFSAPPATTAPPSPEVSASDTMSP